jgi:3-hydroxyacyl-CoA dehydrogenase/enoyl-CoA hydratase/3-hydroxybutyryl-CoA epimerase
MTALTLSVAGGIARLVIDLPGEPVNKITRELRDELDAAFSTVAGDAAIHGVVLLSGKADTFIAGADIDEFVGLETWDQAYALVRAGQALINRIPSIGKPVVAAIHGACLGGGLEAALACDYRIATDHEKTKLGLPEVQLGIIPAAGGCQRLPRLIGLQPALDIILAGKTLPARPAHRRGMVDELVHPAVLERAAVQAAQRLASGWKPVRRTGGLKAAVLAKNPVGRAVVLSLAKRQVEAKTGGHYPAPLAALDAVGAGLRHGLKTGLEREAHAFADLAVGAVSRELVNIFFATTALKKDFGVADVEPRAVARVGIVGAGFMGGGIGGTAVSQAGVDVRLRDTTLAATAHGVRAALGILDGRMKRKRLTRPEHRRLVALVSGGTDWAGFARADLVIEAVFEDIDVKHQVFREIETHVGDGCVLASNTSTIPIARIATAVRRPERMVGMHFFSPVERMPLLEVIVTAQTAPWVTATAVAFGRRMGKTVVVVRDAPGFWVNRILAPYLNEAGRLVAEGADIGYLDRTMKAFGFPVGPLTLLDEVGLDVGVKSLEVLHEAFGERLEPVPGLAALVDAGRLGRKSGRGFYRYERGKRQGVDPSLHALIGTEPARTPVPDVEDRMVYAMLNEAARGLEEGVVRSVRDGDIAAVFGIGFPPFRGGPLRTLDHIGAARAVETLRRLEATYGSRFAPAPVLVQHAERGTRFSSTY